MNKLKDKIFDIYYNQMNEFNINDICYNENNQILINNKIIKDEELSKYLHNNISIEDAAKEFMKKYRRENE